MSDTPPQPSQEELEQIAEASQVLAGFGIAPPASGGGGAQQQGTLPQFIGIPEENLRRRVVDPERREADRGFVATQLPRTQTPGGRQIGEEIGGREVTFTTADILDFGLTNDGVAIQQMQENLISAGLLNADSPDLRLGEWDPASQTAYGQLLGFANVSGRSTGDLLVHLSGLEAERREKVRDKAVRDATAQFIRADPAAVRSTVKRSVQNLIGREPTDDEMAEITSVWRQFESQDLNQQGQMMAARAEFDAGITDTLAPATDVDPEAQLEEFLSQRFAGTVAQNKRVEEMQMGQHNILRMADRMASLIANG